MNSPKGGLKASPVRQRRERDSRRLESRRVRAAVPGPFRLRHLPVGRHPLAEPEPFRRRVRHLLGEGSHDQER
jgi:hypothetical protein